MPMAVLEPMAMAEVVTITLFIDYFLYFIILNSREDRLREGSRNTGLGQRIQRFTQARDAADTQNRLQGVTQTRTRGIPVDYDQQT